MIAATGEEGWKCRSWAATGVVGGGEVVDKEAGNMAGRGGLGEQVQQGRDGESKVGMRG